MSKEKFLASAQKNLEKGQLAKAISDYQKVVDTDPRDVRHRQKLAELYSRARQTEQALGEYGAVAKYYSDNGFYLKAIAVFKQMQRLDPARPDLYSRLAELNQKQGLAGNAAAEYRNLVTLYEGQKKFPEAVGALEKLKDLEPENSTVRIKIVETYLRGGLQERARREFEEVVGMLRQKGELARALRLYELLLPLQPNDLEMKIGYGEVLVRHGDVDRGLQVLAPLEAKEPDNTRILQLLAEGYRRKGDLAKERSALQKGLGLSPGNLDLREAFIRSCLAAGEFSQAVSELEGSRDSFLHAGRKDLLQEFHRALLKGLPNDPRVLRLSSAADNDSPGASLSSGPMVQPTIADASTVEAEPEEPFELEEMPELEEIVPEPAIAAVQKLTETAPADAEAEELTLAEFSFAEESIPAAATVEGAASLPVSDLEKDTPAPASTSLVNKHQETDLEMEFELELEFDDFPAAPVTSCAGETDESDLMVLELTEEALEEVEPFADPQEEAEEVELEPALSPEFGDSGESPIIGDDFIDLTAALLDDFSEEVAPAAEIAANLPSAPKTGIRTEAVQLEDAESHFQLGIAYKEMGLLEEAEKEFEQAARDPERGAACLILKGICLAARGAREQAEAAFKSGLGHPRLEENEKVSVHFELGTLYQEWGRFLDALDCLQFVADHDLFYRQVGERMVELRRHLGLEGGDGQKGTDSGPKGSGKRVSYI